MKLRLMKYSFTEDNKLIEEGSHCIDECTLPTKVFTALNEKDIILSDANSCSSGYINRILIVDAITIVLNMYKLLVHELSASLDDGVINTLTEISSAQTELNELLEVYRLLKIGGNYVRNSKFCNLEII